MGRGVSKYRTVYNNANQTLSGSGVSAPLTTDDIINGMLTCFVRAAPGGTAPTLTVTMEQIDAAGNYISLYQLTTLTTISYAVAAIGLTYPLAPFVQIRWTVGGTTPSFGSTDIGFIGRFD